MIIHRDKEILMGKIFYIMGKSASGKDSIYKDLLAKADLPLERMVLYTTRPIRKGETSGNEYHFVDETTLQQLQGAGKVIESRAYNTVHGVWTYFTIDDGELDLGKGNYLGIGTLESYQCLVDYYGSEHLCPIYVAVEDGERLMRSIKREGKQENPRYEEVCRRFLADSEDFSEVKIAKVGIGKRFINHDKELCQAEIGKYIKDMLYL